MQISKVPAIFNDIRRSWHDESSDIMYLFGFSESLPYENGLAKSIGKLMARYDNWTKTPAPQWQSQIPFATTDKGPTDWEHTLTPHSVAIAGDKVFFAWSSFGPSGDRATARGEVTVYDANSGSYIGYMMPGNEVAGWVGAVDIPYGISAFRRSNGEYLVMEEDDLFDEVLLFRWCASSSSTSVSMQCKPPHPKVIGTDLAPRCFQRENGKTTFTVSGAILHPGRSLANGTFVVRPRSLDGGGARIQ